MSRLLKILSLALSVSLATFITLKREENFRKTTPQRITFAPSYMLYSTKDATHAIHYPENSYWIKITGSKIEMRDKIPPTYPVQIIPSTNDFNGDGIQDYLVIDNRGGKFPFIEKDNAYYLWTGKH